LETFDPKLAAKPTVLVAAKIDVANPAKLKKLVTYAKRRKLPFFAISAVTGEGVEPLKYAIAELVAAHRAELIDQPEPKSSTPVLANPTKRKPAYPPPAPHARGRAR